MNRNVTARSARRTTSLAFSSAPVRAPITTAKLFGVRPAIVLGGLGTLGVVALWSFLFPGLRDVDRLIEPKKDA